MSRVLAAVVALAAGAALAQEIGKEIPASGATTYDNPYAVTPAPAAPVEEQPVVRTGPGPHRGAIGLRTMFSGSSSAPVGATGSNAAGPTTSDFALKVFLGERFALTVDLGFGLSLVNGNAAFGFGFGLGTDIHLGSPDKPVRPFITAGLSFGKAISRVSDDFGFGLQAGGGGEYWFNDHFSVSARMLIAVPIDIKSGQVNVVSFVPGMGGTVYF